MNGHKRELQSDSTLNPERGWVTLLAIEEGPAELGARLHSELRDPSTCIGE